MLNSLFFAVFYSLGLALMPLAAAVAIKAAYRYLSGASITPKPAEMPAQGLEQLSAHQEAAEIAKALFKDIQPVSALYKDLTSKPFTPAGKALERPEEPLIECGKCGKFIESKPLENQPIPGFPVGTKLYTCEHCHARVAIEA